MEMIELVNQVEEIVSVLKKHNHAVNTMTSLFRVMTENEKPLVVWQLDDLFKLCNLTVSERLTLKNLLIQNKWLDPGDKVITEKRPDIVKAFEGEVYRGPNE